VTTSAGQGTVGHSTVGEGLSVLTAARTDSYLGRIGLVRPPVLGASALRDLHLAHLRTVPFENLSIHLDEPVSLEPGDLLAKIIDRRRGGFCYELNGAFALLLESLGARVSRVAARVYGAAGLGPPYDHLALIAELPDGSGPWLADVGFGSHSSYPLDFGRRDGQADPAGEFSLADTADGDVEVRKNGSPQYLLERRPRELADFGATCWYQQTSPQSSFTQGSVCSLLTADGRISIAGRQLIRTSGGERTETELTGDAELLAAYRDHFGISLDRPPSR
jgi:N-hydroxyarylamine O-acetyltransferase